jgi:tetratricopeptide (TPR) repeat protein
MDRLDQARGRLMTLEQARIAERIAQVERDMIELAEQVDNGEIDAAAAAGLQQRYEKERDLLLTQSADDEAETEPATAAPFLSGSRLLGIGAVLVAVIGIAVWLLTTTHTNTSGVEGVAADVVNGQAMNLGDVTDEQMEEVIAQNPDIAPMRLALAERYFTEGDFPKALEHYMYVLDTLGVKDATALANVGWMTYLSGVSDVAQSFVEQSLAVQPDGGIAFWYLANIRLYGLNDPAGAVEPLEKLLQYDDLPDEIRTEAESMLTSAEAVP